MNNTETIRRSLKKRYARERRFRLFGLTAIAISFLFLVMLLSDIIGKAMPAFSQTWVKLEVTFDPVKLGIEQGSEQSLQQVSFRKTLNQSLYALFPEVKKRKHKKALKSLLSSGAQYRLREQLQNNPQWLGTNQHIWLKADDQMDIWLKSNGEQGRIDEAQQGWIEALQADGRIEKRFNTTLFTSGDSREPEQAGILSALMGSLYTLLVTFVLSLSIGVSAAVYLEEFAPQNRMNDTIPICRVEGEILLDGEDIYRGEMDPVLLRARIGMVFQKANPFPKSIYDNVAYGPRLHGLAKNKGDLDEIVITSLQKAGLFNEVKDRLNDTGTGLSGGQQQRLCIARTIAVSPEVILMDEPASALDPIATAIIEELIDELRQNYTIAIVTHSMHKRRGYHSEPPIFTWAN